MPYPLPDDKVSPKISGLLFNISHHGNWVVVAAGFATQLGVDVARVEKPEGESYEDFFAIFQSYFSSKEWMRIKGDSERSLDERQNHERLHRFYHHWCLKESYVKALGLGLGLDLDRIEFSFRYSHEVSPKSMLKVTMILPMDFVCSVMSHERPNDTARL